METDEVKKQIQDILKKSKHRIDFQIDFPMYKVLPEEVKLALRIIQKHGMKIYIKIVPTDQ